MLNSHITLSSKDWCKAQKCESKRQKVKGKSLFRCKAIFIQISKSDLKSRRQNKKKICADLLPFAFCFLPFALMRSLSPFALPGSACRTNSDNHLRKLLTKKPDEARYFLTRKIRILLASDHKGLGRQGDPK